jgi:hypothetical protein
MTVILSLLNLSAFKKKEKKSKKKRAKMKKCASSEQDSHEDHCDLSLPPLASINAEAQIYCGCGIIGDLRRIATSDLKGSCDLATLLMQPHLYAIGMPEGLDRELLVLNSQAYHSYFDADLKYHVGEIKDARVAFLGYANVSAWIEYRIPADVTNFAQLETFIGSQSANSGFNQDVALAFKLVTEAAGLRWFVVGGEGNGLPTPRDSFLRKKFQGGLDDCAIEAFGLYSKHNRGNLPEKPMATSPVSDIHMHFRTTRGALFVAHLDDNIILKPGGSIFFPAH